MSRPMEDLVDMSMQYQLWGAMWTGGQEWTAIMAENHHRDGGIWRLDAWDRKAGSLKHQHILTADGVKHPVPEWFALDYVAEFVALHGYTTVVVEAVAHSNGAGRETDG